MKLKRGNIVTRWDDTDFMGIVQGVKKDKCGQIPVWWILWHGQSLRGTIWIAPEKLEKFKTPAKEPTDAE